MYLGSNINTKQLTTNIEIELKLKYVNSKNIKTLTLFIYLKEKSLNTCKIDIQKIKN